MENIKFHFWQDKLCITYHNNKNYQIFETEKGNFVYDKNKDKVYQITLENFNNMLIKLAALLPTPTINNEKIKYRTKNNV